MTSENGNVPFNMPVMPAYGGGYNNGGFGSLGGDGWWIILLLLLAGNGMWGGLGGFGGMGGMMWPMMMGGMGAGFGLDYLYPWLNNSQHISDGFRDQNLQTSINGVQNAVTAGFGDVQNALCSGFGNVQNSLCSGFAGVNAAVNGAQNAVAQQLYSNEIASLNRSFAEQTANAQGFNGVQAQLAQCCCDNRAATQDVKYTIATEACTTRAANAQNTQSILDKLCQLELDGYKRENDQLRSQLQFANMQASQVAQTAELRQNGATQLNNLVAELRSCPIPAQPVYGSQPIFTCQQTANNCGCGCGSF